MSAVEIRATRRPLVENPLAVAIVLSLVIHLGLFGTWRLGQKLGWWNHHAGWLVTFTQKLTSAKARSAALMQPREQQSQAQEIPLTFLEVDPATAVDQAPE